MQRSIEILLAINLFVIGLSHILQPRAWAELFIWLRGKGTAGVFIVAFMHLPIGVLIVAFHNVWEGLPMLTTILGWAWTIKGFLYFNFPQVGRKGLALVSVEKAQRFAVAGAILLVLCGLVTYPLATG